MIFNAIIGPKWVNIDLPDNLCAIIAHLFPI